jgi:hypothetical protein
MLRRRRPQREIAFSFDSFLDLVTNVVGIILRLILVAWAGARTYKAIVPAVTMPSANLSRPADLPEPTDPLSGELARLRDELAKAHERLSSLLPAVDQAHRHEQETAEQLATLAARHKVLAAERAALAAKGTERGRAVQALALSVKELAERSKKLLAEIDALRKAPSARKTLRYLTPVSAPLQTEEVMFEVRRGRVTLVDVGALLDQVKREVRARAEVLRTTWQVNAVTEPVGAFRLRYVLERQRTALDGPGGGGPLGGSFSYGLSAWEAEPMRADRGESAAAALAPGSAFRRVIDNLDPQQTAVTLWVYADSFPLYRALRDYLHEHDVVVAGRPLLGDMPIASSRHGTRSRGQ